jgi:predicted DNA-binding ribbon-helix-helix protein
MSEVPIGSDPAPTPGAPEPRRSASLGDAQTQHRVVQFDGRRYSLNLERPFWLTLEELAAARRVRLNRLIAEIAGNMSEPNLASRIRVYCIVEQRQRLVRALLSVGPANLPSLAEQCPHPCVVVSASKELVSVNRSFLAWYGPDGERLIGQPLERHFRFRLEGTLDDLWRTFAEGRIVPQETRLISIAPGRVRAINALIQPAQFGGLGDFACLVWLRA